MDVLMSTNLTDVRRRRLVACMRRLRRLLRRRHPATALPVCYVVAFLFGANCYQATPSSSSPSLFIASPSTTVVLRRRHRRRRPPPSSSTAVVVHPLSLQCLSFFSLYHWIFFTLKSLFLFSTSKCAFEVCAFTCCLVSSCYNLCYVFVPSSLVLT